ncbi:MAG: YfiR family protein [Verrucomicrobiota bacterium]
MLGWLLLISAPIAQGQSAPPSEYQIKAAFLYNFAKFVEWPESAFDSTNAPIVFGIIGEDPFNSDLEATIENKTINNRPVVIRRFRSDRELQRTHVLFISSSERRRLESILERVKGFPTLVVGDEIERFCQRGGMINFIMEERKVRFQINQVRAEQEGLKISSKLLKLALPSTD